MSCTQKWSGSNLDILTCLLLYGRASTRKMLCEQLAYFGPGTFQQQLDIAYKDFVAFCRSKKLEHSQPAFKESKAPWLTIQLDTLFL